MNISMVGTGYVGLVAGVCFADAGHYVECVDKDKSKVDLMREGKSPIYEPGLEEVMHQALKRRRLTFTTDLSESIRKNALIFIAVGTPEGANGDPDLSALMSVVDEICKHATAKKYVVLKSTVPIGTARNLQEYFNKKCSVAVEVINNPEFLKEGAAIEDFLRPDRVVIGCVSNEARAVMEELYEPFVKNGHPILFMDNMSAEMTKYAANSFLSVKISFINELARLADEIGADINQVRRGFTSDRRINPAFFYPGVGYGGSCFPKDVEALIKTGTKYGVPMKIVQAADDVNDEQKLVLYHKLKKHFGSLSGLTLAVWGLSFKPRTDDVREAPALFLIEKFITEGAKVKAFDPVAIETAKKASTVPFETGPDAMSVTRGADALVVVTEWNEFRNPDFDELKKNLKSPVVFDGRNVFDPLKMKKLGFQYYSIGRQALNDANFKTVENI